MTNFKILDTGVLDRDDGAAILFEDFGGEGEDLLIVHATGFSARMYLPIAARLADKFHCWGINARHHGGSTGGREPDHDWNILATDILALIDHLGLRPCHGFGHSYGGAGLLLAEQQRPGTFASLFLYEPVVTIEGRSEYPTRDSPLSVLTRKRRQSFANRAEAAANFALKPPMNSFDPSVSDLYLETAMEQRADKSIHLVCPRETEAEIYAWAPCHDAYSRMGAITCPTLIVAGETSDHFGQHHFERLAATCPAATLRLAKGLGHFGPFDDPGAVAALVRDFSG